MAFNTLDDAEIDLPERSRGRCIVSMHSYAFSGGLRPPDDRFSHRLSPFGIIDTIYTFGLQERPYLTLVKKPTTPRFSASQFHFVESFSYQLKIEPRFSSNSILGSAFVSFSYGVLLTRQGWVTHFASGGAAYPNGRKLLFGEAIRRPLSCRIMSQSRNYVLCGPTSVYLHMIGSRGNALPQFGE